MRSVQSAYRRDRHHGCQSQDGEDGYYAPGMLEKGDGQKEREVLRLWNNE